MATVIWDFLADPTNRSIVGWICGGLVALVVALVKLWLLQKKEPKGHAQSVTADRGSVASGGNISRTEIRIDSVSEK
jgi:hypothetical protein